MPEPVTLALIGLGLWGLLRSQQNLGEAGAPLTALGAAVAVTPAAATADNQSISAATPPDALATNTSVAAAQTGGSLATAATAAPVASDLEVALDAETVMLLRAYVALNPTDFQMYLDRFAGRVVLRNDLMLERLTSPPDVETDPEPTPQMVASMGFAAYRVAQAVNGVAVGRSVDIFGVAASAAGQIPGVNQDLVTGLQAAALSYRAISGIGDVMALAAANNVSITDLTALTSLSGAGVYPGLSALPLGGVLMAVGLVVDIAFTIIGDKPDLQKAVDVALDVASLAVLFIPVIGIVIAIVIQLVKFIIDLFGEDLFGGGMTHAQREVLETARYGSNLNPMFPQLANCYTPRELFRTIIQWGSGYCGGVHVVAMSVNLVLRAGDTLQVGGEPYTVPADTLLGPGNQPGCYWLANTPFARITNDEQAIAFGRFATKNGIFAMAQAGISDWRKEQFNDPTEQLIMARAAPMVPFLDTYHLSLDQIDSIALEYRAQPHLNELAQAFGWDGWQAMLGELLASEWLTFSLTRTQGTLADFARQLGYPSMYALRAGVFAPYESYWSRLQAAAVRAYGNAIDAQRVLVEAYMNAMAASSSGGP